MPSSPVYTINGFDFQFQCNSGRHFAAGVTVSYGPEVLSNPDFIDAFRIALDIFPHANAIHTLEEIVSDLYEGFVWGERHDALWEVANQHDDIKPDDALAELVAFAKSQHRIPYTSSAAKHATMSTKGYVYLLQSPTTAYKIGRTKNPDSRSKTFGVQLPFEVEFIALIETDDMYTLETDLHQRYADKRINGEWFALTDEDVEHIKSLAGGAE